MPCWKNAGRILMVGVFALLPLRALAQEATVTGVVTDGTGGALPGVTVTALHEATGNTFVTVTDVAGIYRLPLRVGTYRLTATLSGFASLTRQGIDLLVGQQSTVNLQLKPAALVEAITVTADAPLIERTRSTVGSNVDPKQMQELPLNGRNFVDLTMLAPGSRQNASGDELGALGVFQVNVDGLRVTQNQTAGFGQPKYSKDAIAEFEFVANRFDATQGGSSGTMVNAITKSGTNALSGTFAGYFRNDEFIAKDFVSKRVLPYSDTQLSTTLGGPIIRNRLHFFASYEHELEPQTYAHTSPYPSFNFDLKGTRTERKGLGRGDVQFTPRTRLSVRGNMSVVNMPYDGRYTGGATRHPSAAITTNRHSGDMSAVLTKMLGASSLNEFRGSYASYYWIQDSVVKWPGHPYGLEYGTPIIQLRGYTIGQAHTNSHEDERQWTVSFRDSLTFSFNKQGRHDVRMGGEYSYQQNPVFLCNRCMGLYDAGGGPIPSNIESLFPVWNDVSTWNLAGISSVVRSYTLGVGQMQQYAPLTNMAGWVQDDWRLSSRLTANLGVRYDFEMGVYAEDSSLEPFLKAGRPNDKNNIAPRLGAAFSLTQNTVIRGGFGRFFADPGSHTAYWTKLGIGSMHPQVLNDGRADFAANPFNGPTPTFEQVAATLCSVAPTLKNCLRRTLSTAFAAPYNEIPYSNQGSIGVQRQLGDKMVVEADYAYTGSRAQNVEININLAYDPATGVNYPFTTIAKRPYQDWASVVNRLSIGESNYHSMQVSFTKRMSNHWQASATYLLSGQWNLQNAPIPVGCQYVTTLDASGKPVCNVPVVLHPTLRQEWYLGGDQRNRVTFNGIWDLGKGVQLSGLYLFGDNGYATPTSGVDALATGGAAGRVRSDGTIIARNSFDMPSLHRLDMRLQKRFLVGHMKVDGMVEVFNVFNHVNYGTFVLNESNARYGQPDSNLNSAYQPRLMQLGFRVAF
jgi:Carboxypeptidase regulatory-like domain/TonB dependent receptor